ncbi:MAG: hypothetical protein MUO82_04895 [Candidatus Thermoplasmatota archaeon]|nr:hypothetical protein [Candidatus Thermoplasmatota archaeon]
MKKIFGIFVVMLLITCGISYSVTAFSSNRNSQLDDEKVLTSINDPLTIRAEVKEIGDRKVLLSAYATNTLDEQIIVYWGIPCLFSVLYLVPNEEDLGVLVYYPYHKNIFNFIHTIIKFEPGEEKLIQTSVFFGISNWILPGLSRGYKNYIPSFPWLPDGDYRFDAYLNPYFIGNEYPQYHDLVKDTVFFHFGA